MSLTAQIQHASRLDFVRVFSRLASTNTYAARAIEQNTLPPGDGVILALTQTAGRGRGGNRWWSTQGSLTVTFVLDQVPDMPPAQVPLRAGLAVLETAARLLPDRNFLRLKWPNDVLAVRDNHAPQKLAGLLCERVRGRDILGIGLNVTNDFSAAPEDVRRRATSLRELGATATPPIAELIAALAGELRVQRTAEDWLDRFAALHHLNRRKITITEDGQTTTGQCEGLAPDGRLILRVGQEQRLISSGTVGF